MRFSEIINISMATIYLACGVYLLIGNNIFNFSDFQKTGLGSLLIAYGSFRMYTALKKRNEQNDTNEE